MHVLVLVENYPGENSHEMMYVHVRNKYYLKKGIGVTVLNFRTKENYVYEGIEVISLEYYKNNNMAFDALILHAANLKHHYMFLNKYEKRFENIVFFYHGHEILKLSETYPPDYEWVGKTSALKKYLRNIYDEFKFIVWRKKLKKIIDKTQLIFVSNWLYSRFLYYIHLNPKLLDDHVHIINNSVGEVFEKDNYDYKCEKKYDFITIRGSALDKGKYGIDIVTELAKNNPKLKFLVVGKGKFYNHVEKPKNVEFINGYLKHDEMISYLNKSRCALLPTRQDTQGVMTCEVATFGMPTITSDIEVCREIFERFDNVVLVNNDGKEKLEKSLKKLIENLPYKKNETYFAKNTIEKEVELLNIIIN